ncbi:hypothetical protein DPMN_057176 [Dreissena polymorpha]|uniref:Uncharacterized protein n=1 Tax=Dreissena polymorpha TaxID=45954 RepID=A0A9D4HUA4_DREPO|nr:hypothetical protein DPMN_057176 [Dreissena polymorpha]
MCNLMRNTCMLNIKLLSSILKKLWPILKFSDGRTVRRTDGRTERQTACIDRHGSGRRTGRNAQAGRHRQTGQDRQTYIQTDRQIKVRESPGKQAQTGMAQEDLKAGRSRQAGWHTDRQAGRHAREGRLTMTDRQACKQAPSGRQARLSDRQAGRQVGRNTPGRQAYPKQAGTDRQAETGRPRQTVRQVDIYVGRQTYPGRNR